jgi:hypothetical protein
LTSVLESLARLSESSDAAEAFERLKLKSTGDGFLILGEYIEAEQLFREFPQRITKSKATLAQMEQLENHVAELRKFVDQLAQGARLQSIFERKQVAEMRRGLKLIANRIEAKRCNVKEGTPQFGLTRKTQSKEAAENAAIWIWPKQFAALPASRMCQKLLNLRRCSLGKKCMLIASAMSCEAAASDIMKLLMLRRDALLLFSIKRWPN